MKQWLKFTKLFCLLYADITQCHQTSERMHHQIHRFETLKKYNSIKIGFLQKYIAKYYSLTLLPNTIAKYYCQILLPNTIAKYYCQILLPNTIVKYYCLALLPNTIAKYYCQILLPTTIAKYNCQICTISNWIETEEV